MSRSGKLRSGMEFSIISAIVLLLAIFGGIVSTIGYMSFTDTFKKEYASSTYHIADTATKLINGDHLAAYLAGDEEEEYQLTKEYLDSYCKSMSVSIVYLIQVDTSDYGRFVSIFNSIDNTVDDTEYVEWELGHSRDTTNEEYRQKYQALYEEGSLYETVYREKTTDGTHPHITTMVPVRDSSGDVVGILCVQRPIRELEDDPQEESSWLKANPVLRYPGVYGDTLREQIRTECELAYGSGDADKIRMFLTRRCCLWQADASSANKYLTVEQLEALRALCVPRAEFAALTDGRECYAGYDLGKRIDLSGTAAVWALPDGRIALKAHGFLPENAAAQHERTDRVPYIAWAKDGYCTLTPGDVTDNSYVENWICEGEREHRWKVKEIDYDGHNATDLAIAMREKRGEDSVVEIPQTCAGLNQATKRLRELILQGKLVAEYSPLLLWCCGNAVEVVNNFGDIKLSKRHKDDSQRIDPLAAALNALARLLVAQETPDINEIIRQRGFAV